MKEKKKLNMGYNTCHCALFLRDDLIQHVKQSKELGFQYIRFHNVLSNRIGVYYEDENGNSIYNFEKFDLVYDKIISSGFIPFFEISFTPEALKSKEQNLTSYSLNTSIPKDFNKWYHLVRNIVLHVVERYGINCVKKWYFEVWNEPDIGFFDGELRDYLELYDYTALAVKSVSEELRIGGPATSKCAWINEFINHIEEGSKITDYKKVPCDFISTHAYPSDIAFVDSDRGDVKLQNSNIMKQLFKEVREKMNNSSLKQLPLFMGEWNSSAGPLAYNHDEKNNAAFIIKTLIELKDIIDGSLYWDLSDIYEECGFHYTPFHGGYGIVNVNSIPKSSYNAFKILKMVEGEEIGNINIEYSPDGCGIYSVYNNQENCVNILLYYYKEPDSVNNEEWKVELKIKDIMSESLYMKEWAINDESGSSYEWWKYIGSPDYLNIDTMKFLLEKSKLYEKESLIFMDREKGIYEVCDILKLGDVKLIKMFL